MIMDKLPKIEGRYYITKTGGSNSDNSIFTEAMVMRADDFRLATEEEVRLRRAYEESRERMANEIIQEK